MKTEAFQNTLQVADPWKLSFCYCQQNLKFWKMLRHKKKNCCLPRRRTCTHICCVLLGLLHVLKETSLFFTIILQVNTRASKYDTINSFHIKTRLRRCSMHRCGVFPQSVKCDRVIHILTTYWLGMLMQAFSNVSAINWWLVWMQQILLICSV